MTTKIDANTARSAGLKADVKELQDELAKLAADEKEMVAIRQKTHADYLQAKADYEQGIAGVRKALVMLRDYYAAGDAGAAFVQQPAKPELYIEKNQTYEGDIY